jgi:PAS domain S-box-containing protein
MNISSFNQELSRVAGAIFSPSPRYQWRRYGVAVLTVAIAFLLKLLLNFVITHESPFLVFFGAVLVSARYGGMGAGLLATFLSALVSDYFFLSPGYSFINPDLGQNLRLFLFVTEGILISEVVASLNAAKRRANLSKQEALYNQEFLRQSEERFRLLIEDVKDYAIFMINTDGRIISWNAGVERIFGYQEAEIIGQQFSCIFTAVDIQTGQPEQELDKAVATGRADDERWHLCKDGTTFWASGVVTALRDDAGNLLGFTKVVRDITERKQAEDALRLSDERLRLALEVNQASTWDWDIATNKITWCHNHELLFGLTPGTFDGTYQALLKCIHPEERQLVIQEVTRAIESNKDYDQEYRIVWYDGSIHWLAVKGKVFYDKNASFRKEDSPRNSTPDQAVRMVGLSVDITNLKRTADQIKASLKEKEVLLKEIHHRVKNNLQIISSLLNLQAGYIEDQKTIEIFKQCENRVGAMALIHEQLYQSHDLAKIGFADYVKTLAANLFSSYGIISETEEEDRVGSIALKVDVNNIFLSVDAAIPCGLLINELISNSLEHAFSPAKKGVNALPEETSGKHCIDSGEIRIGLHADNNNYLTLSVSDNGIGFPKDLDFRNTNSLGLQIVTALSNQLEGTIELNRNTGTEFKIKFQQQIFQT